VRTSAAIQTDLDAAVEARRVAMTAQSYSTNTGQGSQGVTRANLKDLNDTIKYLTQELEEALDAESGNYGIYSGNFRRY